MSFAMVFVSSTYSFSESNPPYARQKKWRTQEMSVIMFSFLMDLTFNVCAFNFWSGVRRLI